MAMQDEPTSQPATAPGALIMPGSTAPTEPAPTFPVVPAPEPAVTSQQPVVTPEPVAAPEPVPATEPTAPPAAPIDDVESDPEEMEQDESPDNDSADDADLVPFTWQASEYLHHDKSLGWYLILAAGVLALLVIAYFTHQWLAIGVFVAMFAALVVYAQKPPRTLTYEIDPSGITIDGKLFPFSSFRSFGLLQEISWHAIDLEPTQRFMPRLTILFETQDFDPIVAHLAAQLPRLDRQPDFVERAARYLKF